MSADAESNGKHFSPDTLNAHSGNLHEKNVFKFNSDANSFNLEITFLKHKTGEKNNVLAALKEVYNKVKSEQRVMSDEQ